MPNITKHQAELLCNNYAEISNQIKVLEKQQSEIKDTLAGYMRQHKIGKIETDKYIITKSECSGITYINGAKLKSKYNDIWQEVAEKSKSFVKLIVKHKH